MARPVLAYLLLFLALMLVVNVSSAVTHGDGVADVHPMDGTAPYVPPEACNSKCTYRCSETSHKKPCMFFCNKCCTKCHCVPSGTYGHKDECPCYRDWRTKEGGPKCP